jgi:hypothetical protein
MILPAVVPKSALITPLATAKPVPTCTAPLADVVASVIEITGVVVPVAT